MQTFDLSPPSWGHGFLSAAVRVRNASLLAPTAPAHRRTAALVPVGMRFDERVCSPRAPTLMRDCETVVLRRLKIDGQ